MLLQKEWDLTNMFFKGVLTMSDFDLNNTLPDGDEKPLSTSPDAQISDDHSLKEKIKIIDAKLFQETYDFISKRDLNQTKISNTKKEEYKDIIFTDHGIRHIESVDKIVGEYAYKCNIELNNTESIILFLSVWLHDIGMYDEIYQDIYSKKEYRINEIREKHELTAAKYIQKYGINDDNIMAELFKRLKMVNRNNLINTICNIIKYHRRKFDITQISPNRYFNEKVRADLLASLLRIADTLSIDSNRFDKYLYMAQRLSGDLDRESMFHWMKSYLISAIYLDNDYDKMVIRVVVDLPAQQGFTTVSENTEKIRLRIYKEIEDDLIEVNKIFFRYKEIKAFKSVNVVCDYVTGIEDDIEKDIRTVISDLDIIMSPNSSFAIIKALENIADIKSDELDKYFTYLENESQSTCKTGIYNIVKILRKVKPLAIKDKIIELESLRKEAKLKINEKAKTSAYLSSVKHIFLFGYSQMVIDLLSYYFNVYCYDKVRDVEFYVFDCTVKTRYSSSNSIDYHDGINYSNALVNALTYNSLGENKYAYKVNILPDSVFSTLISHIRTKNIDKESCLLLTGANGIYVDKSTIIKKDPTNDLISKIEVKDINEKWGYIFHSTGHHSMISIANSNGIPITVVVDKIKFSDELKSSLEMKHIGADDASSCWIPLALKNYEHMKKVISDLPILSKMRFHW